MKHYALFALFVLSSISSSGQQKYDDGPIIDGNIFVLDSAKWATTHLKYYINNSSIHMTATRREAAIQNAFATWSSISVLSFEQVYDSSLADIRISWVTGNHGDGIPFDGPGNVLAHAFFPYPSGGINSGCLHFDDAETIGGVRY